MTTIAFRDGVLAADAFGSGRPEALGAMFAGADAATAIRAAIEHDSSTFGDIDVLRHEPNPA